MRALTTICAASMALASASWAQTPLEAAAANAQISMQLCLQNYFDPPSLLEAFKTAGFDHQTEDFGGGEIVHWFYAPENTVQTAVILNDPSVECRIGTSLWGVEAALPFVKEAMAVIAPAITLGEGSPEGVNILPGTPAAQADACSGVSGLIPRTYLWVQIERQGNDGTCVSDGTSVIRMRF